MYEESQPMKLICSIVTIIERGKTREDITIHICSPCRVCGADTKAKIQIRIRVGMLLPYKLSHLTSSRGARNDASKIENNKTQQLANTANNNQILAAAIAHIQDARHPIHRVRFPYFKFSSPKSVAMFTKVA